MPDQQENWSAIHIKTLYIICITTSLVSAVIDDTTTINWHWNAAELATVTVSMEIADDQQL